MCRTRNSVKGRNVGCVFCTTMAGTTLFFLIQEPVATPLAISV